MCDISKLGISRKCTTGNTPIKVYIMFKNEKVGLCDKCWGKVADTDLEWGDDNMLTLKELLGRRQKEEAEATLTEYKFRGVKKDKNIDEGEDDI